MFQVEPVHFFIFPKISLFSHNLTNKDPAKRHYKTKKKKKKKNGSVTFLRQDVIKAEKRGHEIGQQRKIKEPQLPQ